MAYSYNEVTVDASPKVIAVPEYIDQAHIKVSINGVDTTSFSWVNSNTVSVPAPIGSKVRVRRETSPQTRLVDYMDGTGLTEAVLDTDSRQAFFLAQEQLDATNEAIDAYGSLATALALMVQLNAESTEARDEAETAEVNAEAARDAAITARNAAQAAQTAAEQARDTANSHKNAAATSASNAATSETNAANSASAAATSASNASTSASNAATSASNAAGSASAAATSASQAAASAATWNQPPLVSFSANRTLGLSDAGCTLLHPSADTTGRTVTIPSNTSVAFPINTQITIINMNGAGTLQLMPEMGVVFRRAGDGAMGQRAVAANGCVTIIKVDTNEWYVTGIGVT